MAGDPCPPSFSYPARSRSPTREGVSHSPSGATVSAGPTCGETACPPPPSRDGLSPTWRDRWPCCSAPWIPPSPRVADLDRSLWRLDAGAPVLVTVLRRAPLAWRVEVD